MRDIQKNGGPAFPLDCSHGAALNEGMSLRDWFAGQTLTGIMANADRGASVVMANATGASICDLYATMAYEMADAMLKARK